MNRWRRSRAEGRVDRAIALPLDPETNDELAEAAEHFVLDRYGFGHQVGDNGPGSCDWWTPHACGDVKWTPRENGGLMTPVSRLARHACTAYVLVVGRSAFRIAGWTWGFLLRRSRISQLGHVPSHYIPQEELRDPRGVGVLMAATYGHHTDPDIDLATDISRSRTGY